MSVRTRDESECKIRAIKISPGMVNMKTAARHPRKLMAVPMLGTKMAHRRDKAYQHKTTTHLCFTLVSSCTDEATNSSKGDVRVDRRRHKSLISSKAQVNASRPQNKRMG